MKTSEQRPLSGRGRTLMIPPSTPSGPQRGPKEQHAPETQRDPEHLSYPDLQDGPDPAPPLKTFRAYPDRKRIVHPSAPGYRPHSPESAAAAAPAPTPPGTAPAAPPRPGPVSSAPTAGSSSRILRWNDQPALLEPAELLTAEIATSGRAAPPELSSQAPGEPPGRRALVFPVHTIRHIALIRRIAVSAAAAAVGACAVAATVAVRDGNPLAALSPDAVLSPAGSLVAPAAWLWWIWLPVAAGWVGYALYQWLPEQRTNPRHSRFGWMILAAGIVSLVWLLAAATGSAAGLLAAGAAQTALGLTGIHGANSTPAATRTEAFLSEAPLGLFLAAGTFTLTTSLAYFLTRQEADLAGWGGTAWALIALVTVTVGITTVCMTDRGHLSLALAAVFALACVSGERLAGLPQSTVIGAAAAACAFLVLVSAGSRRHQVDHERRRNERRSQP
ncbi:hypothetical protein OL239_18690 [Arthrobacter sp. ATA002]|uniref:hypothetical protein n=1 Tax=Arthrobacter sp. ATA002 TaxID=2991715 RepID=UPI0022A751C1|nr:hypothetical protein [Arthrobacter sp. ATA002]WAP51730.1 hypothetical protein OL239_18690 [Arthrobacter sp. ATA002]